MASKDLLDVFELAELYRPAWAEISRSIPAWHPRCEDPPADPPSDLEPADQTGDPPDPVDPPSTEPDPDKIDWKAMARKHEARAKKQAKDLLDTQAKLKEREDADKTEQEKAIETAREEGRTAALTEAQKERRSDRLEVTVTRLAARGVELKDGDKTKTVKFADPEDALVFIERAIARGDLDEDDVFDDQHRVKTDAVTDALTDLLERKPRLAADDANGKGDVARRVEGGADAGKGKGAGKSLEEMTPDDHLREIQGRNR